MCDLFGVDVSHFATHLTTINLATRDLIDDKNYPQIIRSDFFNVDAHKSFICLPRRAKATGLGSGQHRNVEFPPLDAVVGNPPYVRQEDIRKAKKSRSRAELERGTKEYYRSLVATEAKARLSGRSDIHCYFWPHATTFLKEGGYLCFLTSSQWLDVEYGFRLQGWILSNFRILAILESIGEPWFIGARVGTAITILQRELDGGARMENCVCFVQLRQPIRDILSHDGTAAGAVRAADYFRDEILSLSADTVNARYRARVVRQGDLWDSGVRLREIMVQPDVEEGENEGTGGGDERTGLWQCVLRWQMGRVPFGPLTLV